MTELIPKVKRHDGYFVGRVSVVEDGRKLYEHSCGVTRTTSEDALLDAVYLAADLEAENNMGVPEVVMFARGQVA